MNEQPTIFIPPHATLLSKLPMTQVRLGLQGYPGTGKTWSCLRTGAPNPLVLDYDNKLSAHRDLDVNVIQFHDPKFLFDTFKLDSNKGTCGYQALPLWLRKYGVELTFNQTLVLDSASSIMNSFDSWWEKNPSYSKDGKIDSYAPHKAKVAFWGELVTLLKGLKCHVILTMHESVERDDEGRLTGKVRPLMSGQFADQIAGHFTDWFRQVAMPRLDNRGQVNKINGGYEIKEPVEYFWQIQKDAVAETCTSLKDVKVKYARADFKRVFIDGKYNEL